MELKEGMYVRTKGGYIRKCVSIDLEDIDEYELDDFIPNEYGDYINWLNEAELEKYISKASHNIIDLVEYMDLLVIENKVKDIDNREIYLFNPVRCDGFTEFEGGKRCMIINMDYIIPIENIKVYQVLTHEIFEEMSYKVGD